MRTLYALALRVFRRLPVGARRFVVRRLSPSFTVGAICVIEREADDAVLLARLTYRRRWGLPGGLTKRGEPIEETARREAREETGLDIELVGPPAVVVAAAPRRVDVVFRCRPLGDSADVGTASAEIHELRWFPRSDLPELHDEAATALAALGRLHAERAQQVGATLRAAPRARG